MDIAVRPSRSQVEQTFNHAYAVWSVCKNNGINLPEAAVNLTGLVNRAPKYMQNGLVRPLTMYKTMVDSLKGTIWICGQSRWAISNGNCHAEERTFSHKLLAGIAERAKVVFTPDTNLQDWPGVEGVEVPKYGNCIAVLVLAWAYIFSARWTELQNTDCNEIDAATLVYAEKHCQLTQDHPAATDFTSVDLEFACKDAINWWAAVLSVSRTWQASTKIDKQIFFSPWSIETPEHHFRIFQYARHEPVAETYSPPSAAIAANYLAEFCNHYGAHGQSAAALAIVMLLPHRLGSTVTLPRPRLANHDRCFVEAEFSVKKQVYEHLKMLPRYMSLSCYPQGIRALFHGAFYEHGIQCNVSGAWLKGAFAVLDDCPSPGQYCHLVWIMSKRQPGLACLWLAACLMGTSEMFLRSIRTGMFAVDTLTGAWTQSTNSFIGPILSLHDQDTDSTLDRADECRLLYLIGDEDHINTPVCPFPPFGRTPLSEVDLVVKEHYLCGGQHCLEYSRWYWQYLDNDISESDSGLSSDLDESRKTQMQDLNLTETLSSHEGLTIDETISMNATRSIFGWLRPHGQPKTEAAIFSHPWFQIPDFDSDDDDNDDTEIDESGGRAAESKSECPSDNTRLLTWLRLTDVPS